MSDEGNAVRLALFEEHLTWAEALAERWAARRGIRGADQPPLVNAARVALWIVASRYRPGATEFRGYAYRRLTGALQDACREASWAPRSVRRRHRADAKFHCQPRFFSELPDAALKRLAAADGQEQEHLAAYADYLIGLVRNPKLQAPLRLWGQQGWTKARIARHMGCSKGRVALLLRRGIEAIHDHVGGRGGGG